MIVDVLNFFSEKARGFILTLTGTGAGTLPELVLKEKEIALLYDLQVLALVLTGIVAILTIISYGYKFYKFMKSNWDNLAGIFRKN